MIANGPAHALVEAKPIDVPVGTDSGRREGRLVFVIAGIDETGIVGGIEPRPRRLVLRIGRCGTPTDLSAHCAVCARGFGRSEFVDTPVDRWGRHTRLHVDAERELRIAVIGFEGRAGFVLRNASANRCRVGAISRRWRNNGKVGAVLVDVTATRLNTKGCRRIAQCANSRRAFTAVGRAITNEIDGCCGWWADPIRNLGRAIDKRNLAIRSGERQGHSGNQVRRRQRDARARTCTEPHEEIPS